MGQAICMDHVVCYQSLAACHTFLCGQLHATHSYVDKQQLCCGNAVYIG
jgi:hypothetical protein